MKILRDALGEFSTQTGSGHQSQGYQWRFLMKCIRYTPLESATFPILFETGSLYLGPSVLLLWDSILQFLESLLWTVFIFDLFLEGLSNFENVLLRKT